MKKCYILVMYKKIIHKIKINFEEEEKWNMKMKSY